MTLRRRETLALTGAFLAGLAGCAGSDPGTGTDDPTTGETTTTEPTTTETTTEETTEGDETTTEEDPDFEDLDAPPFPEIDPTTDPEIAEDLLADQIRGNVGFALDLLAVLREREGGTLFASPYSVSVALAMTYAGARGGTADEMADALRYVLDGENLHAAFGSLEAEFERRNEDGQEASGPTGTEDEDEDAGPAFELSTANAVWGQDGYPFREDFLDLLEAYYGAGTNLVDFAGDPEAAREEINDWVAERTDDRIEDLLPRKSVDETTRLVLTNAVYFGARWKFPFDEDATEPREFTALDGTTAEVSMMTHSDSIKFQHAEIEGHHFVELPYANGETSMVVVVPAEGEFEAFEEAFTVDRLAIMLDEASTALVNLTFPKFGIESEFSLVEAMEDLGMEEAFGPGADFSGMAEGGELFVDDIRHKSFVEVDELGTEAAAATAVIMTESAPPREVDLTVDRPFLFYIRDEPTETPLFVGRVTEIPEE
ncbi:serpin family protein [Halorussus salilacus]|uniref:serpin family protein n=1 Tax=Halorussus salilacus TaxID=2953750 RepID=UPI0020A1DDCF|nr:serpin family protein [Halorussus salilacus]USZ67857.1 serpin family protein [Halorussus salilacus]